MKVKAIGVQRMKGIGKQSGAPFDFAQLVYLQPIQGVSSQNFSLTGFGFEVGKLDLQIEALHKFNDVKFPADLELIVETVPDRRGFKSMISGFVPARSAA